MTDANKAIEDLSDVLMELIAKDKHHEQVKVFVKNCGNTKIQEEWNSMTNEEQKAVSDALYYYFQRMEVKK